MLYVPKLDTIVTIMDTKISAEKLASGLFGKTRRAVLALLFTQPDESFYLREVAQATGAGLGAVQRELKHLNDAGIILRRVRGRQVYFQADPDCPIFTELQHLVLKTSVPGGRDGYLEGLRRMGPADKIRRASEISELTRGLSRAGIRRRHPEMSDQEVERELWRIINESRRNIPPGGPRPEHA